MKFLVGAFIVAASAFLTIALWRIVPSPASTHSLLLFQEPGLSPWQPWSRPLNPGVYQSYPYAMMIIIPGQVDRNILPGHGRLKPGETNCEPVVKPGLILIPRAQMGK